MSTTTSTSTNRSRTARAALRMSLAVCCALAPLTSRIASAGVWTSNGPIGGNGTALAVDPTTPTTMYAGTNGGGLFKSSDGGTTWSAVNNGVANVGSLSVEGLVVDPSAPARVYAAVSSGVSGGVLRTTNGGASWTLASVGYLTDIAIDPVSPSTLWATGAAVYKSSDAGATWTPLLTDSYASVTVDPSSPSTVYAGTIYGAISKTTNGGASWTTLSGLASDSVDAIAVHPATPSVVYAGLEDFGVYKSVNGGMTWTPLGPVVGTQNPSVQKLAIDPASPDTVYAAGFVSGPTPSFGVFKTTNGGTTWSNSPLVALVRALVIDPASPATLLAGTQDGIGIWKSTNGAGTWSVANAGLVNTQVGALASVPSQPGTVWAATAYDGVFRSSDGGGTWDATAFTGFLEQFFSIAADPTSAATAYVGTHFDGVYKTIDAGATWSQLNSGNFPALIGALVVDPSTPAIVYAGGFGGVARSTTGGGSWTLVNNGLPPAVTALAIDPSAPGTLYAATDPLQGPLTGVYKTTNGGGVWTQIKTGLPSVTGMAVQALALDPAAPATVYAGLENGGVYKTINGGTSWTAVNGGLTTSDVQSLAVDPVLPETVYAATGGGGVFLSTNGGASWSATNSGLYNQYVRALAVEPGRLYAGTIANGAFVADTATLPPQTIRGKTLVVQDPKIEDPSKRKITVVATEPAAAVTLDLDTLITNGATVTVSTQGQQPSTQTFALPGPWKRVGTTGARYTDNLGVNGPVKSVVLSKSASGLAKLTVTIVAKPSPSGAPQILVVPPNPGTAAQVRLQVNGGATYCAGFGGAAGGTVVNKGPVLFRITNPTTAVCS